MQQRRDPLGQDAPKAAPVASAPVPLLRVPEHNASRYLMTLAAAVIVIAGMKAAAPLLGPLLLAIFLAVVAAPPFMAMRQRGVPTGVALLVVVGVMVVMVVILTALVNLTVRNYADLLVQYQPALRSRTAELFAWLEAHGIATSGAARDYFNLEWAIRNLGAVVTKLGDLIATAFIVLVITIFMLLEATALPAKVRQMTDFGDGVYGTLRQIGLDLRRYMVLKTMTSLLTGALVIALLLALGVDFALTLGLLAFVLNFVPVVGALVASAPGIVLALLEFGFGTGIIAALGYLVINLGIHNGVEPRYMGHDLNLAPLVILISVIFWGWILGALGMLLAVPITMTLKVILEAGQETHWLGLMLGAKPAAERPAG